MHKKRLLEESLERATAVQYHHIEHCDQVAALESSLFIALESSYFLLHWKVRMSNGAVLRLTPPTLNFAELKSGDKLYFGRGPDAEN